ncbi:HNH endonuclease [Arcicella sp. DC2W]|uniref:HNH endonuclease n=1 Tax=Arcicella gelida TaxID=2984195 RepID=A0ABU5RZX6_9BACT|nr:HNH endonuclease [Arcicella sp. DC2W]MEA5401776.1 HNH endonuclease [Arcicella sp. DC2W]
MNCLFCKQNSDNSKSVEHIIPESLGNKEHILDKGFVCDKCNQYFALKIEKPLLEQPYFRNVRHRAGIESKKGRIPIENAIFISPELAKAEVIIDKRGRVSIVFSEQDEKNAHKIFSKSKGSMIIPAFDKPEPNNKILSRFLAKVAVEALLYYLIKEDGWIEEVMNKPELDEIKNYARNGVGIDFWKYNQRRIYSEETRFNHSKISIENYEVLHEFRILITKENHYYFVIAIMGIEYTIGYGGSDLGSFLNWLEENNNNSILDDIHEQKSSS